MTATATIRLATATDAPAILEHAIACDLAERGEIETTIEEVRTDLATEGHVAGVIGGPAGEVLGFVWVEREPEHKTVYGDLSLRPGASESLAPLLLDWLRARANECGPGIDPHVFADSKNDMKCRLYESVGGEVIRRFYRMGIALDGAATDVPPLGDGVEIRGLVKGDDDLRAMHDLEDSAFADHYNHESYPFEKWLDTTANGRHQDLSLWWLATVDGEPVAGLYGSELPTHGYVGTLGTIREYRGRGLASALLLTAFAEFRRRGLPRATLAVDATNPTGAVALYESVGMTVETEGRRYELPAL